MKARNFFYTISLFFSLIFLGFIVSASASTGTTTNLEDLQQDSEDYLYNALLERTPSTDHPHLTIVTRPVDNRLKLAQCDKPLTYRHRSNGAMKGSISVKVSCLGSIPWSTYVKHTVQLEKNILVINGNLPRNHPITEADLSEMKLNVYGLRAGYMNNRENIVGKLLKRPGKSGDLIYPNILHTLPMIKKGDRISVVAQIGLLSVVTPGIALNDGLRGEQIDVENKRSSRIIRAIITGPSTVKVIM